MGLGDYTVTLPICALSRTARTMFAFIWSLCAPVFEAPGSQYHVLGLDKMIKMYTLNALQITLDKRVCQKGMFIYMTLTPFGWPLEW